MLRIAIVEDDDIAAKTLESFLSKYSDECGCEFGTVRFADAETFLTGYKSDYDIVFMDIELPVMNGMEASFKLRELDDNVTLIFVTNMAQYAVKGYEVQAFYFIVKPISYFNFKQKLDKAIKRAESLSDREISINCNRSIIRLKVNKLKYIEVMGHQMIFHCESGNYVTYGSLRDYEATLEKYGFARCNNCYLINLKFVSEIKNYEVIVDGEALKISRPKRKFFVSALNNYYANGG